MKYSVYVTQGFDGHFCFCSYCVFQRQAARASLLFSRTTTVNASVPKLSFCINMCCFFYYFSYRDKSSWYLYTRLCSTQYIAIYPKYTCIFKFDMNIVIVFKKNLNTHPILFCQLLLAHFYQAYYAATNSNKRSLFFLRYCAVSTTSTNKRYNINKSRSLHDGS